ncbi:MAG: N-acetylmuramoyl-L-alanine amidase [Clostridiales bacterium]|jgi:N-acetylmuramoyl-L-alanine amidase|nr:N-acetylmuramoyl-L-alanine amidase [Clostridiales bacterium]
MHLMPKLLPLFLIPMLLFVAPENIVEIDRIIVAQPARDREIVNATGFNFFGSGVAGLPIYVNGEAITNRTDEGFFSIFLPLNRGRNYFTFTQYGQEPVTRVITNNPPQAAVRPPPAGQIRQIDPNAHLYARITTPATWAFPGPTATGGTHWKLHYGQQDRVTATMGNWLRLASGQWVSNANVLTWTGDITYINNLSHGYYIVGEREDAIVWNSPTFPAVWAEFDGRVLIIGLGKQTYTPTIAYNPNYALFESISMGRHNQAPAYFMTLRENANLEGFYFEHEDNQLRLILRKRPTLNYGDFPLYGFTFVIDPGHGGNDPGALGPLGAELAEAHLNLIKSRLLGDLLEGMGARVIFTREDDSGLTLSQRVAISREILPDMFISMHANSTAVTTDATNIHGFTMWYRNPNSRALAQNFFDALYGINPLTNRSRNINQANFYVVRPSWTPSVLFETSFMNNIHDFAWMINPQNQRDLARGIADAILEYYGYSERKQDAPLACHFG